ncbi:MAG: class I SAM-dependent methyltransferase [Clostridia bacterium]|nr:class I SAM-dependent methyltransferase [Clostridia bacterium]
MGNQIIDYYNKGEEKERLDERFGRVEFLTTVRYVEKYLFPGARILEVGAGTGRYSHYLARLGYRVDALELVPLHIEQFKADTLPNEDISVVQGDARELSAFENDCYDMTLVLGPLYHLTEEADKKKVISEALRVTKTGGVVFAAYILNEMTVMNYLFRNNRITNKVIADNAEKENYRLEEIQEKGLAVCRIEDINSVMNGFSVERLHLVGTDMISGIIRELLEKMSEEAFGHYVNYVQTICERPDMIGMTGHILDIFRKKDE